MLFYQYVLKECFVSGHTLKIAFLGILSKSLLNNNVLEYVKVKDPVETLKHLVKQLQEKVNLIVLLSPWSSHKRIITTWRFGRRVWMTSWTSAEEPADSI